MFVTCLVGARRRSNARVNPNDKKVQDDDRFLITEIISSLKKKHSDLFVISYACDNGVGKITKDICGELGIKFGEIVWYFHGDARWEPSETAVAYLKRNATALEMGDIFIILAETPEKDFLKRKGMVEDLVDRLKQKVVVNENEARPYVVLDESGSILEGFKQNIIMEG